MGGVCKFDNNVYHIIVVDKGWELNRVGGM